MEGLILLKLFLAHLIGDFILQKNSWVEEKRTLKFKSKALYLHTFIHSVLAYVFVADWACWYLPVLVFVFHTIIDLWKTTRKSTMHYFVLDQGLHFLSLLAITLILSKEFTGFSFEALLRPQILLLIIAYLLVLFPYSLVISMFTAQWREEIRVIEKKDKIGSLEDAGKYIGMLERVLVLTFILSGNASGIGMLIAAKSILRFNDLKGESSRKMSEYVLIGTLLSFSLCIITGLIVKHLLTLY